MQATIPTVSTVNDIEQQNDPGIESLTLSGVLYDFDFDTRDMISDISQKITGDIEQDLVRIFSDVLKDRIIM